MSSYRLPDQILDRRSEGQRLLPDHPAGVALRVGAIVFRKMTVAEFVRGSFGNRDYRSRSELDTAAHGRMAIFRALAGTVTPEVSKLTGTPSEVHQRVVNLADVALSLPTAKEILTFLELADTTLLASGLALEYGRRIEAAGRWNHDRKRQIRLEVSDRLGTEVFAVLQGVASSFGADVRTRFAYDLTASTPNDMLSAVPVPAISEPQ